MSNAARSLRSSDSIPLWHEVTGDSLQPMDTAPSLSGVLWSATASQFVMRLPGVFGCSVHDAQPARFHCEAPGFDPRLFLQGLPLAAHWVQRGRFALNAAAVATPAGAILLIGGSLAGKSTLAAAFAQAGHAVLADGVTPIDCAHGRLIVEPSLAAVLLTAQATYSLALPENELTRARAGLAQHYWDAVTTHEEAMPLCAVYLLRTHNKPTVELQPLRGHERLFSLLQHSFNRRLPATSDGLPVLLARLPAPLRTLRMSSLARPDECWTVSETVAAIYSDLASCRAHGCG